jgi:hypothetical protein
MSKQVIIGADSFEVATQVADKFERMQAQLDELTGEGKNKDEEDGEKEDEHEGGSSHEEEEEEDKGKKDKEGGRSDSNLTAADVTKIVADGLKGFRDENRKDAKREAKERQARDDASKVLATDIATAKENLPKSYKFDGKGSAKILFDACVNVNGEMEPKLEPFKTDASYLRGMLAALGSQNSRSGASTGNDLKPGGDPNVTRIDEARKKRADQRKLTQAQLYSGAIGTQAVRKVVGILMQQSVKESA